MDGERAETDSERRERTREAYDRLAPVWSATTDDGPFNGWLERPALRSLVPRPLTGATVLDAGCGSGAQCQWLLSEGAEVVGIDLSPAMVTEARRRCAGRGEFVVADLADPLTLEPASVDGITSSLVLHYLADWKMRAALLRLRAAARGLGGGLPRPSVRTPTARPGGWLLRHRAGLRHLDESRRRGHPTLLAAAPVGGCRRLRRCRVRGRPCGGGQPSPEAIARFPDELGPVVGVPCVHRLPPAPRPRSRLSGVGSSARRPVLRIGVAARRGGEPAR